MQTLRVSVWRGAEQGAFQSFEVPRHASQTVLDVITHIQRHIVGHHQYIRRTQLIETGRRRNRMTAAIHVILRLYQQ